MKVILSRGEAFGASNSTPIFETIIQVEGEENVRQNLCNCLL